jgi:SAM-dependent methyltransferase
MPRQSTGRGAYDPQVTGPRRYLPAASLDVLLPAYDPLMRLLGFTTALQPLLEQAELQPHHAVLDIGCGTGTLALLIGRAHPGVAIVATDPDPRALTRAAGKTAGRTAAVRYARAFADALPFADAVFDRVFSSMMFHHVSRDEKPKVLADVRRVLRPGGRLEFLDFVGGARSLLAHALHGRTPSGSAHERLLRRMREAGFADARRVATRGTLAGAVAYYQAIR